MKTKHLLITTVAVLMAITACTENLAEGKIQHRQLRISVKDVGDNQNTRTAYAGYSASFENLDAVGVYAYDGTSVVAENVRYVFDGTEWSTTGAVEYDEGYTYYLYYPYVASPYTPDFTQSAIDDKFALFINDAGNKFHQTNQSTKAAFNASDLMIAQGEATEEENTVSFTMYHKKGLAVLNGDDVPEATFTGTNIPYILGGTGYYLMKPSTATTFSNNGFTYSLAVSGGHYVTQEVRLPYTYHLTVNGPQAYSYQGGTNQYAIQSYKVNDISGASKAAAWTVTYDTDGDDVFDDPKPAWLTAFTASGAGSVSSSNYSAVVAAQSLMTPTTASASSILAAATPVSDYDLSDPDGVGSPQNTANCYIVHAPGTYKIPLVYGNAIKNGTTNPEAYNPTGTAGTNFLKPFINHAGTGITNPWIENNGVTVDGAQLVWQDTQNLIRISSISFGDGYMTFEIKAADIAEGNAVIAAMSGAVIVWSWHIWVTPENLSSVLAVSDYDVAPVNLGWVNSQNITRSGYEGRICKVKIRQTGVDGLEQVFTIKQHENISIESSKKGYCTYYQWGRKDPELPSTGSSNAAHSAWNESNSTVTMTRTTSGGTIQNGIKNPLRHYVLTSSRNWQSNDYYNLWDGTNTSVGTTSGITVTGKTSKTIYDPCPPGYCVPTNGLYAYIVTNSLLGTWDNTNKGRLCNSTAWFPAAGFCSQSSATPASVNSYGYYHTTVPNYASSYKYTSTLYFGNNSTIQKKEDCYRNYGMTVRPVKE